MIRSFSIFGLLILSLAYSSKVDAQCQIPNGSFTEWNDFAKDLDESWNSDDSKSKINVAPIPIPKDWSSLRFNEWIISDDEFSEIEDNRPDTARVDIGIQRIAEGSNNFVGLIGNEKYRYADISISTYKCAGAENFNQLKVTYRYQGQNPNQDSLVVEGFFNSVFVSEDSTYYPGRLQGMVIGGNNNSKELTIDLQRNDPDKVLDTMFIFVKARFGADSNLKNRYIIEKVEFLNDQTGISKTLLGEKINVFPNPAEDRINVSFEKTDQVARIDVLSALGKRVFSSRDIHRNMSWSISSWPPSLYFIRITDQKGDIRTLKFIKE